MKEPYWEKIIREKLHFLYPSAKVSRALGKYTAVAVITFLSCVGLYAVSAITWEVVVNGEFGQNNNSDFDEEFDDKWDKIRAKIHAELSAVSEDCALYSSYSVGADDPINTKLADFTNLYPLSDFLCGDHSNIAKVSLSNGKNFYFIAPVRKFDCGNGGCNYYPFIEEQPGLVRHLRGFDKYEVAVPYYDHTQVFSEDIDGSVFFKMLHFDPEMWTISMDDEIGNCITTNTYKIAADGTPQLIRAYDVCSNTVLFEI